MNNENNVKSLREVQVALAGCGTVGGELVRQLERRADAIEEVRGLRFRITRVLVRDANRPRPEPLRPDVITTDVDEFLHAATQADVVVEAVGGLDPAAAIAAAALEHGRAFVTANKALVAERGAGLAAAAERAGGQLHFEAAVAGGVPVIRVLRDALQQTGVRRVRGILNGTCNYVLDRMTAGEAFADAVADAQARGFAEADPTRDLDGRDAADKIRILAWLAFGADPAEVAVRRVGLLPDPTQLVADAAEAGGVVKLVAECAIDGQGAVTASVEPAVLPPELPLAQVEGAENVVAVETEYNGTIRLAGPGAGGPATASAVLADVIQAASADSRAARPRPVPAA